VKRIGEAGRLAAITIEAADLPEDALVLLTITSSTLAAPTVIPRLATRYLAAR